MVLTITKVDDSIFGDQRIRVRTIAFDASYPTGGESLTAADLDLDTINFIIVENDDGFIFKYNYATSKLLAYYADYDAVADGALIQVADTTDLSGITTARALVIGR